MPHPAIRLAAWFLSAVATASALTVVPSALHLASDGTPNSSLGQYTLTIYQDAAQTNPTSIFFDYDTTSRTLTFRTAVIDESSDWYFTSSGQSFSLSGISAGDYSAFTGFNQPYSRPYGDFYLDGATGLGFTDSHANRTVLGWAHFQASASGIILIDSAVAYDAGSITVGTLSATAIPEPASVASLAGLGALALGIRRRRLRAA